MWMKTWPMTTIVIATISCSSPGTGEVLPRGDAGVDGTGDGGPAVDNQLVFSGADGRAIQFPQESQLRVWCGPFDGDTAPAPALHIAQAGPREEDPAWMLDAVLADVKPGLPLTFPNSFPFNSPQGARLFAHDGNNEASTAEEGSSGSLTFHQVSCDVGGTVELTLDAVLGSEVGDGAPITAKGTFRGVVGAGP
jgi:hypothetical protein